MPPATSQTPCERPMRVTLPARPAHPPPTQPRPFTPAGGEHTARPAGTGGATPPGAGRGINHLVGAAGELEAGGLDLVGSHQRLADQHGVDPHVLELVELLAGAEARLGDDGL